MLCLNVRELVLCTTGKDDGLCSWSLFYIFPYNRSFCFPGAAGRATALQPCRLGCPSRSCTRPRATSSPVRPTLEKCIEASWSKLKTTWIVRYLLLHKNGGKVGWSGPGKAENSIKRLLLLVLLNFSSGMKKALLLLFTVVKWIQRYRMLQRGSFRTGLGIPASRIRDFKILSCKQCFSRVLYLKSPWV